MKKTIFLIFAIIIAASSLSFAQAVTITPKKTVYTRKGKNVPQEKRTFSVTYPVVSGAMAPALKKKLENTISYWRVFQTTLAENLGEYDWLSDLSYKVNYNKKGVLNIALMQEGAGAYPSTQTIDLVVDTKTGEQIKILDAFKTNSLPKLAKLVNQRLEAEKSALIRRIDKNEFSDGEADAEQNNALKEQIKGLEFTADTFDQYSVSDKGVTFIYDAGFPHAIQAAQPDGRYFFSWAELKPYIKPEGLLGRFVR